MEAADLFWAIWPCVASWLQGNFNRTLVQGFHERRREVWKRWMFNTWVEEADLFPPPLVDDSDDSDESSASEDEDTAQRAVGPPLDVEAATAQALAQRPRPEHGAGRAGERTSTAGWSGGGGGGTLSIRPTFQRKGNPRPEANRRGLCFSNGPSEPALSVRGSWQAELEPGVPVEQEQPQPQRHRRMTPARWIAGRRYAWRRSRHKRKRTRRLVAHLLCVMSRHSDGGGEWFDLLVDSVAFAHVCPASFAAGAETWVPTVGTVARTA